MAQLLSLFRTLLLALLAAGVAPAARLTPATPAPVVAPVAALPRYTPAPAAPPAPYTLRWRVGVGVPRRNPLTFAWPAARPGWFHNWYLGIHELDTAVAGNPPRLALDAAETRLGMAYLPMISVRGGQPDFPLATVAALAAANRGRAWLVGNEPDIATQDWVAPAVYAAAYHDLYAAIKTADPTAQIVAGNVSQITPLRLRYLDAVLAAYRDAYAAPMPVDVWGIHTFVLREEAGSWGAGMPPGIVAAADEGMRWSIADHGDPALVADQMWSMRRWMAEHGYRDTPLWVTEYGILMPAAYGFPPDRVSAFLETTFDAFRTTCDPTLGLPTDGHRLVQRWLWFSAHASEYPTGDLFTAAGLPTTLTTVLDAYLATHATAALPSCDE